MQKALIMSIFACFCFVLGGVFLVWTAQVVTLWSEHPTANNVSWVVTLGISALLIGFGFGLSVSLAIVNQLEKQAGKA